MRGEFGRFLNDPHWTTNSFSSKIVTSSWQGTANLFYCKTRALPRWAVWSWTWNSSSCLFLAPYLRFWGRTFLSLDQNWNQFLNASPALGSVKNMLQLFSLKKREMKRIFSILNSWGITVPKFDLAPTQQGGHNPFMGKDCQFLFEFKTLIIIKLCLFNAWHLIAIYGKI